MKKLSPVGFARLDAVRIVADCEVAPDLSHFMLLSVNQTWSINPLLEYFSVHDFTGTWALLTQLVLHFRVKRR